MRWSVPLLAAVATMALIGCGDRSLVVKVDVLSYLHPDSIAVTFGPVPATPGGLYSGEQTIMKDIEINMVDGLSSVADVEGLSLNMSVMTADSTGSGADTLRLYMSDVGVDPLSTAPVMMLPVTFTPGVTDTVSVEVGGDTRMADLFAQKHLRLTFTTAFRGPDSGEDLNARIQITSLQAILVAGRRSL
jgi:hypothetical protein